MNVLPVDLNAVLGIFLGSLIVLIPVAGLTARFALKTVVEAIARAREAQQSPQAVALLERRLTLLEQQLQQVDASVDRMADEVQFLRQLAAGEAAAPAVPPAAS